MDRQNLSIQLTMRALSVYEHDNPQKSDEVKNAQNTLQKALEYYFKKGYCSPDVPQSYRLLRGAEKERKKMFTKDFSKSEAEYREKNIRFFEILEEKKEVSILQNYGYTDWYSLLQVETEEDEISIPVPVFLNIIDCEAEKNEEDEYSGWLTHIFSSNGIKVNMIIDRFDEQHDNLRTADYPDFVGGLITDKNMLLKLLETNDRYIGFSSQELRDDPEVIIEAVRKDHLTGRNFVYASPRLKRDKDFVLKICQLSEISVDHVDSALLEDYEVVEALVKSDGDNFSKLPEKFRGDKNLLLMALEEPVAKEQYLHASAELKNDREVVLKAVKSNSCWILEHVPEGFKADAEVVMEACKVFSNAIKYASSELQNDRGFALKRATVNALDSDTPTEKQWWDDEEIVLTIVKGWGHRLEYASERLRSNKKISLEAVNSYPKAYRYIGKELKNDPDIKNIYEGALRKEKGAELTEEYLDHRSEAVQLENWQCLFLKKHYFLERTDCSHPKNDPNFCQLWILPEEIFNKIFEDRKKLDITIYGISKVRQNFEKAKRALRLEEEATLEVKINEIIEFHYTHSSSWGDYDNEVMFSIIPK